jgi:hypothetical protein
MLWIFRAEVVVMFNFSIIELESLKLVLKLKVFHGITVQVQIISI